MSRPTTAIGVHQPKATTGNYESSSFDPRKSLSMLAADVGRFLSSEPSSLPHRSHITPLPRSTLLLVVVNAVLIAVVHMLLQYQIMHHKELFYLYYQPFAPVLAMIWLWALAVRHWEFRGVRYDICFPVNDQVHLIPSGNILRIAGLLSSFVLLSACAFLVQCLGGRAESAAVQPVLVYATFLILLVLPGNIFHGDIRRFFASTFWRVMTPGLRPVTFSDFLLADILTSLAKALSDVERAVCLLASGPIMSPRLQECSDASWIIPLGLAAPYVWRLMQCLRVYYDTGARSQLANAAKYFTAFPVIVLSAIKYHVDHSAWIALYKPLWLLAAAINSAFSYYWDIERDWEIGFFSQMRAQNTVFPSPSFSTSLTYRRPVYWYLMASNAILRLSWIYKLSPHLRRNHTVVFVIVLAEAFRRFQWLFVRIEVELRKIQESRPDLGKLVPPPTPSVPAEIPLEVRRIHKNESDLHTSVADTLSRAHGFDSTLERQ